MISFLSRLTLVLCQFNDCIYYHEDFHVFLIDVSYPNLQSIADQDKNSIIQAAQKTILNMMQGSIEDFEFR